MFDITKLLAFDPKIKPYAEAILQTFQQFDINTNLRQCHFLAQVCHESNHFKAVKENLNYSAAGLRAVFPKYFPTDAMAAEYARQPAKIANLVYGNRMGNGDVASGDGFRYSGMGVLQITGKSNYTKYSMDTYGDDRMVKNPGLMAQPPDCVLSAGWFWKVNKLNELADKDDILAVTKRINGGTKGLIERTKLFKIAKSCA